jgi:hypothetical protein
MSLVPRQHRDQQRLVLTVDVPEGPKNEKLAIEALATVVRHFEYDAVYPTFMRLELGQAVATAAMTCPIPPAGRTCPVRVTQ